MADRVTPRRQIQRNRASCPVCRAPMHDVCFYFGCEVGDMPPTEVHRCRAHPTFPLALLYDDNGVLTIVRVEAVPPLPFPYLSTNDTVRLQ